MSDVESESVPVPYLSIDDLTPDLRAYIAATPFDQFWADDWSPDFYRAQARLGFIAVASEGPVGTVLIPELQQAYAVLDWADLAIDHGVRRLVSGDRLERERVTLVIDPDPGLVLEQLAARWGERTWLVPEYGALMQRLATPAERARNPGFRILGTTLFAGEQAIASELGYLVGAAYVSLSGCFNREARKWNHFGKLQMVLLALRLQSAGVAFWNLGHPYMEYKTALGARIIGRARFLPRWDVAAVAPVPDLCREGREVHGAGGLFCGYAL